MINFTYLRENLEFWKICQQKHDSIINNIILISPTLIEDYSMKIDDISVCELYYISSYLKIWKIFKTQQWIHIFQMTNLCRYKIMHEKMIY